MFQALRKQQKMLLICARMKSSIYLTRYLPELQENQQIHDLTFWFCLLEKQLSGIKKF